MMKTSAGEKGARDDSGPVRDPSEEGKETHLCQAIAVQNCLQLPGISILDKLIKTCPVWLQLNMSQERAGAILGKETAGIFLVRKESNVNNMVLAVRLPVQNEAPGVLEYSIKEEKSILYLEGSVLVFEDIFKLVAFYCVSRDLLPFTLKLPQAILEASSFQDLEIISSLGIDFWDSYLNHRRQDLSHPTKDSAFSTAQADSSRSTQCFASSTNHCSCEIELSIGNDRLWFVNPIFIEECSNPCPPDVPSPKGHSGSIDLPTATMLTERRSPRRPPPPPPSHALTQRSSLKLPPDPMAACEENKLPVEPLGRSMGEMRTEGGDAEEERQQSCSGNEPLAVSPRKGSQPSAPPRRRPSERTSEQSCVGNPESCETPKGEGTEESQDTSAESRDKTLPCKKAVEMPGEVPKRAVSQLQKTKPEPAEKKEDMPKIQSYLAEKGKSPPIPPPRRKRVSQAPRIPSSCQPKQGTVGQTAVATRQAVCKGSPATVTGAATGTHTKTEPGHGHKSVGSAELEGSRLSLEDLGGSTMAQASTSEPDSYSTSSTEDDLDILSSSSGKKTRSVILAKAKNRLSLVNLSNVFTVFLSSDRKLQKKIVELAQDKDSYFGNLVRDYRVYSLEMMAKQSSSTEMLQEIRLMMTQLKSYLVQSTELKSLIDPASHTEEQLEVIAETALYKCVLKPLKEAINSSLKEIHSKDGSLQQLKENQLVIQNTTTTDLGITTSVPETAVLEKILHKFTTMHKTYSPEKKIAILLKTCKLIYDSMTQGNPGKHYGADDFLPVLMYVLARSNLTEVLLNVEYMMELMDPALQLGEGSYYLTTTYGVLEHIKNYDKITVTRQLSVEVQDSIHRWERRRTLNKARASRSSVQDFICISFLEVSGQSRTLASRRDTTAEQLSQQCAEKFEVPHPKDYGLFVYVDDQWLQLDKDALPHHIKASLLKSETKKDFHFIYKPIDHKTPPVPIVKELDFS